MNTTRDEIRRRLRRLLEEQGALPDPPDSLDEQTGLLGHGIGLDSIEVVDLVSAIEDMFDLEVDDDQLGADRFETFGSLIRFVEELLA